MDPKMGVKPKMVGFPHKPMEICKKQKWSSILRGV